MRNSVLIGIAAVVVILVLGAWILSPDADLETTTIGATDGNAVLGTEAVETETVDVNQASEAATDSAMQEIAEGDAPTSQEAITESREAAVLEGTVGAEAFQPETFDMILVVDAIENSDLTESEQRTFILELENAENDPERLGMTLEDLRVALAVN